jgi:hypothetical protein
MVSPITHALSAEPSSVPRNAVLTINVRFSEAIHSMRKVDIRVHTIQVVLGIELKFLHIFAKIGARRGLTNST